VYMYNSQPCRCSGHWTTLVPWSKNYRSKNK